MHDPDERPRFRWRLLLWAILVLVLLPVLYVAMVGPVLWWDLNHSSNPAWFPAYYRTLAPLNRSPQLADLRFSYEKWWRARPPLRSWKRATLRANIEFLKANGQKLRGAAERAREAGDPKAAFWQEKHDVNLQVLRRLEQELQQLDAP